MWRNLIRVSCGETSLGFIFVTLVLGLEVLDLDIILWSSSWSFLLWLCSLVLGRTLFRVLWREIHSRVSCMSFLFGRSILA